MRRPTVLYSLLFVSLTSVAHSQTQIKNINKLDVINPDQKNISLTRPMKFVCPSRLDVSPVTSQVPAGWHPAVGAQAFFGAYVSQQGTRSLLTCSYRSGSSTAESANLTTHVPIDACVTDPDKKTFNCITGTKFEEF